MQISSGISWRCLTLFFGREKKETLLVGTRPRQGSSVRTRRKKRDKNPERNSILRFGSLGLTSSAVCCVLQESECWRHEKEGNKKKKEKLLRNFITISFSLRCVVWMWNSHGTTRLTLPSHCSSCDLCCNWKFRIFRVTCCNTLSIAMTMRSNFAAGLSPLAHSNN